jgi:hypothetical protein
MSGKSSAITMISVVFPEFFQTNSGRTRWNTSWLITSVIHLLPSRSAPDTLFNSTEQSPSWEANRPSARQEIPAFYAPRRLITEFTTARHLSLFCASSIQSMPPPPSNLSKIHFNIILPPMRGSPKWSPSVRFPHQNTVRNSLFPHTCYMSCPSQSSWLDHPNDIWWGVQSIKLLVM